MPRKSLRRRTIDAMQAKIKKLRLAYHLREAFDDDDISEDEQLLEESDLLRKMEKSRYLFRRSKYRKNRNKFDLEDTLSYDSNKYNNEEFLSDFRITRDSFFLFLEEMKTKKAFVDNSKSSQQRPISYQLLVFYIE